MHFSSEPQDQLQLGHHQRLYEPSEPWYEVLPVHFILGKLPIMPDFGTPTIPHKYQTRQQHGFPRGKADSSSSKHDGSKLYYINHFAMTWSRSKPSLFRYDCCVQCTHLFCTSYTFGFIAVVVFLFSHVQFCMFLQITIWLCWQWRGWKNARRLPQSDGEEWILSSSRNGFHHWSSKHSSWTSSRQRFNRTTVSHGSCTCACRLCTLFTLYLHFVSSLCICVHCTDSENLQVCGCSKPSRQPNNPSQVPCVIQHFLS